MAAPKQQKVAIFVSRSTQQWIVRDSEGEFWIVPLVEDPWENRQPFQLSDEADLEPVPGHYRILLRLPF